MLNRRQFTKTAALAAGCASTGFATEQVQPEFKLNFIVASCMYGYESLDSIMPELGKLGTKAIDIWPKVHGSQREQVQQMGVEKFSELLDKHQATLGCITQYKLGPFALAQEFPLANRFGCKSIVSSVKGGKGLKGEELKQAVAAFSAKMKPEFERAAEAGIRILLENHGGCMVESIDGIQWLLDACEHPGFGFALAPAHLPQDSGQIAKLIRTADQRLAMFYAWQYGAGFMTKMPYDKEMLQMPGIGKLDFRPIVKALAEINFSGWTEVMMHPTPRGIPIAPTTSEVTQAISNSQVYLENCLRA